jgi:PAS domain S-box-containing protein
MVGMLGVANRSGGYDNELVRALDPLVQTCANAIFASRADLQQKNAQARLLDEQARIRGMLDGVFDGIVTIDEKGLIESINPAAEQMFEFTNEEIVGRNISLLIPKPFRDQHDHFLATFVETGQPNIIGLDRELPACRKNGEIFPVQLRVTQVHVQDRRLFTGIVRDLSKQQEAEQHVEKLKAELKRSRYGQMIGRSSPMLRLYQMIEEVAKGSWPVLIEGETGVGKELVARAIHAASFQRDRPFVATNIAGLTDSLVASHLFGHRRGAFTDAVRDQKGLFETADGGTLFLDEIGDVSQTVQTSMLRVLEEGEIVRLGDSLPRKVDVRVICATNGSLYRRLESGEFRKDLLYRLKVARILVPPLCERRDDLPLLIEAFLAEARAATGKGLTGFTPDAMMRLLAFEWPGNVRELRNVITYVAIHCKDPIAGVGDLPPELLQLETPPPNLKKIVREHEDEKERILAALKKCGANRSRAARLLGISRATLYRRLEKFGIRLVSSAANTGTAQT